MSVQKPIVQWAIAQLIEPGNSRFRLIWDGLFLIGRLLPQGIHLRTVYGVSQGSNVRCYTEAGLTEQAGIPSGRRGEPGGGGAGDSGSAVSG
jgi:hypothetical protein